MENQVDLFFDNRIVFKAELNLLRSLLLECGLQEYLKWKQPCYSYNKKNIGLISAFKDCCFISFFKGALLGDTENILQKPGENSDSGRLIKFTSLEQIVKLESTIKAYIFEAIEVEKAGLKIITKSVTDLEIPEELESEFKTNEKFEIAFKSLTPGRQKGYIFHFVGAKQSKTKIARIKKNIPRILDGFGLKDCTCGLTKRKPNCDGSHKGIN